MVVMAVTESSKTWFDHHPWGSRLAFLALGIAGTLFVKSGLVNYDHERDVKASTTIEVRAVDNHKLNRILAAIPKATPSKTEKATTEPSNCIPHPEPRPIE